VYISEWIFAPFFIGAHRREIAKTIIYKSPYEGIKPKKMNIELTFTKTEEVTNFYNVKIDVKNLNKERMDKYQLEEYEYYLEKSDPSLLGQWLKSNLNVFIPDDSTDGVIDYLNENGTFRDSKMDENVEVL